VFSPYQKRDFVNTVNGFKENITVDLMEKYLSRVRPENKKPKRKSYKIYSKILDDDLWLVPTDNEMKELVTEDVKDAIYTREEVSKLIDEGISKDGLVAIHKVKKIFTDSRIEGISKKVNR
jgi:hypothetical protein